MSTTPSKGDPSCVISSCGRIIAQVDCKLIILQNTTGCIDIQLFGADELPLDLRDITQMEILLFDEFGCDVARFFYPSVPSGCTGGLITFLQEILTDGAIANEGLIRICLTQEETARIPSVIFAEIVMTIDTTETGETGSSEVIGISAIEVAQILKSRIYNSSCDSSVTGE